MTRCFTSTHHSAFTRPPLTWRGVSIAKAGPADVNAADCAVIRTKNNDYRGVCTAPKQASAITTLSFDDRRRAVASELSGIRCS